MKLAVSWMWCGYTLLIWSMFVLLGSNAECLGPYFGRACASRCNCAEDAKCDARTGVCPGNQCADGFWGTHCLLASSCTYNDPAGIFYRGPLSETESGAQCMPWREVYGENVHRLFSAVDEVYNECRNPQTSEDVSDVTRAYRQQPYCWVPAPAPLLSERQYCQLQQCACPAGWSGVNCAYECGCYAGELCDPVTGDCGQAGCPRGFTGTDCRQELVFHGQDRAELTLTKSNASALHFRASYSLDPACESRTFSLSYSFYYWDGEMLTRYQNSTNDADVHEFVLEGLISNEVYRDLQLAISCELASGRMLRYPTLVAACHEKIEERGCATAPGPVSHVQVVAGRTIHVSWWRPSGDPFGIPITYTVHYQVEEIGPCKSLPAPSHLTGDTLVTERTAVQFLACSDAGYYVDITPRNDYAQGETEKVTFWTGYDLPLHQPAPPVLKNRNPTLAVVAFPAYPCERSNAPPLGYEYRLVNDQTEQTKTGHFDLYEGQSSVELQLSVTGASYHLDYRFENEYGPSPWSNPIQFPMILH